MKYLTARDIFSLAGLPMATT